MRRIYPVLLMLCVPSLATADEIGMRVIHPGHGDTVIGAPSNFTGIAHLQPVFAQTPPSRLSSGIVTFEPGARSAWHTHPAGQVLVIVAGTGWVQEEGKPRQTVRAGDVVWTPPGVKHWHGATSTTSMTQVAIQENVDGRNVDWLEKVDAGDAVPAERLR
jgi:quercetin dioxygenase-like cupin family protein